MSAREVLGAASGLLLVLAAGLFVSGLLVLASSPPPSDTLSGAGIRLFGVACILLAVGMGFSGLLAAGFGKETKR